MAWSLTAAAATHRAVFAGWPAREIVSESPNAEWMVAQLVPIASRSFLPEPPVAPLPERQPPRRQPAVMREPRADESTEPLEEIELPPPSLAFAEPPPPTTLPRAARILEPISASRSGVALRTPMFSWPELRNPRAVIRFLRRGYNPLDLEQVPERYVTLSISITANGVVDGCEVSESSGYPVLDELALAVINEVAQFSPGTIQGVAVPVVVVLSIPFAQPW